MKKLLIILLIVLAALAVGYLYLYKGHRSIENETPDFTLTTAQIQKEYSQSDSLANAKFLDKAIVVSGKVTEVDKTAKSVILDGKLTATFGKASANDFVVGETVTIKGRFIGYDDLLEEFRMDQITTQD